MAEPGSVSAGRLELEVVADLSEFERKLQREVDRRVRDARARIRAELDARKLEAETAAAAKAAERSASVRVRVDRDALRQDLASALLGASSRSAAATVEVTPTVDAGRLKAEVEAAARGGRAKVEVEADTLPARDALGRFVGKGGGQDRTIGLDIRIGNMKLLDHLDRMVNRLALGALAAVARYTALGVAAGVAGSGLLALAAAGTQAVGVLAVLPGVAGAAAQGLVGLMIGMSGIGAAYTALGQADKQAGASAQAAAAAREAAAERIKAAEQRVKDAREAAREADEGVWEAMEAVTEAEERVKEAVKGVAEARQRAADVAQSAADQAEQAARRIASAERSHAEAVKGVQRAREALNDALKAAKERLEDLALAEAGGKLDEESAQLAIERAKQRLEKVMKDPFASDLDKREADLAYRQALQRLKEVKESNDDLAQEKAEADAKGVEGSDQVKAAQEALEAANQRVKDAEQAIADARKEAARQAVEGARRIKDANDAIADAHKRVEDAQKGVEDAQKNVQKAYERTLKAAEAIAEAQRELAKAKRDAATAGQTGGGGGVDPAAQAMAELSPQMQDFVRFLHTTVRPLLKDIRFDVQEAFAPGLQRGVELSLKTLDTLDEGLTDTGQVLGDLATEFGEFLGSKDFQADLKTILDSNNRIIGSFGGASIRGLSAFSKLVVLTAPYGEKLADKLYEAADALDRFLSSREGQTKTSEWLQTAWSMASKLWRILVNVGGALGKLIGLAAPAGGTLLEDLAQGAEELNKWMDRPDVQAGFKEFFDKLVPLLREAGSLGKEVVIFVGKLVQAIVLDDTLKGFLEWLRGVVHWLSEVADSGAIGEIASWVLIIGGVVLAFTKLYKAISLVVKALQLVGKAGKGLGKLRDLLDGGGGGDSPDGGDGDGKKNSKKKGGKKGAGGGVDLGDVADLGGGKEDKSGKAAGKGAKTSGGKGGGGKLGGLLKTGGLAAGLGTAGLLVTGGVAGLSTTMKATGKPVDHPVTQTLGAFGDYVGGIGEFSKMVAFGDDYWADQQRRVGEFFDIFRSGPERVQQYWSKLWGSVAKGTDVGVDGSSARLGGFLKTTQGRFVELASGAPKNIQLMWADIQRDIEAGRQPSQAKLDAFAKAGGLPFLALAKNAPEDLRQGWSAVQAGVDTFTSQAASKLGSFASSASGKFLELKANAPASVQSMWGDIQAKIAAGLPVPQQLIDDFVAHGGTQFLNLKKGAPQSARDMLAEINRDLDAGLAAAGLALGKFVQDGGGKFLSLRKDAPPHIRDLWADIQRDIDAGRQPSQAKLDAFAKAGGLPFAKLSKDAPADMKKAWSDISNGVDPGLDGAKKNVAAATKAMSDSFGTAKEGIGKSWDKIPGLLRGPVAWIVNNAYTGGIKKIWDSIANAVGLPPLPGVTLAFARGGIVPDGGHGVLPGYSPGRDSLLAKVTPGEGFLRPELTRVLGKAWINGGNRAARRGGVAGATAWLAAAGLPGFASGGVVGNPKSTATATGTVGGKKPQTALEKILANLSAGARTLFSKGLGAGARTVLNPIKGLISSTIGTTTPVQRLLGGVPRMLIDRIIGLFDGKDHELNRDTGGPVPRGKSLINNGTRWEEWVLTGPAVAALGGPTTVQRLNEAAASGPAALYRASRQAGRAVPTAGHRGESARPIEVHVHPQPGQDEHVIADQVKRRIGALVRA